ncbi:hypothetical protein KFE25_000841 [Diacronema lutheri]|mgnify:CR=1 FL=1|uniref:Uncharacterized protein n=1 Tax=Diacronema lutheri TaxID=2081491 RepID=A0A8J6CF16_DIALT|nr:hypothetical protein KFE25_000841 [Diacronema lutheri]
MFHRRKESVQLDSHPTHVKLGRLAEKGRIAELRDALIGAPDGAVNQRDANGFTPLLHACAEGHVEIVRLLLEHGASTEVSNFDGETALHLAASIGYDHCVEVLVAAGANVSVKTSSGKSALDLAQQMGHANVLTILESAVPEYDQGVGVRSPSERAPPTVAQDARDLAFALLEADLAELHDESLEEMATILEIVGGRISAVRASRTESASRTSARQQPAAVAQPPPSAVVTVPLVDLDADSGLRI